MRLTRNKLYLAGVVASIAMFALPAIANAGFLSRAGTGSLSSENTQPSASAAAIGLGGLLEVSKSSASMDCGDGCHDHKSNYSYVTLLGENLLGVEPDGDSTDGDGNWTGALAPAGALIDPIEGEALECQTAGGYTLCLALLSSDSYVNDEEIDNADAQGGVGARIIDPEGHDLTITAITSHARVAGFDEDPDGNPDTDDAGHRQCAEASLLTAGGNGKTPLAIDRSRAGNINCNVEPAQQPAR